MRLFTEHPQSVGETYGEHLVMASGFGWRMMVGGFACLLHGLFPFLFVKTGSRIITGLHDRMVANRAVKRAQVGESATSVSAAGPIPGVGMATGATFEKS